MPRTLYVISRCDIYGLDHRFNPVYFVESKKEAERDVKNLNKSKRYHYKYDKVKRYFNPKIYKEKSNANKY